MAFDSINDPLKIPWRTNFPCLPLDVEQDMQKQIKSNIIVQNQ